MLRRFGIGAVLALIVVALTASVAVADHRPNHQPGGGPPQQGSGNPHFVGEPSFFLNGNTVTATGSIAGLGNTDIDLQLLVTGTQTVQCENPGGNIAPGQTQELDASSTLTGVRPEQGRVNFDISTTLVGQTEQQLRDARACPNPRWTPLPGDVEVTGATLNVYQPSGSGILILTRSASF
jgi:hypothetical protein